MEDYRSLDYADNLISNDPINNRSIPDVYIGLPDDWRWALLQDDNHELFHDKRGFSE